MLKISLMSQAGKHLSVWVFCLLIDVCKVCRGLNENLQLPISLCFV